MTAKVLRGKGRSRRADKGIEPSRRKGYLLTLVRVWRNR